MTTAQNARQLGRREVTASAFVLACILGAYFISPVRPMLRCFRRLLSLGGVLFCVTAPAQSGSESESLARAESDLMAAARPGAEPQFNGARVLGIQPHTPFLCALAVSGERPMTFAAAMLPRGLNLDRATGIISGSLARPGDYNFTCRAANARGQAETRLRIQCGETLALTPPMGWNSYDAFGDAVTEAEVLANAAWLKAHLQPWAGIRLLLTSGGTTAWPTARASRTPKA